MEWLWIPGALLALLLGLLICPVRYRLDASREGGRFSVSVLYGVYMKTFRWEKKKEAVTEIQAQPAASAWPVSRKEEIAGDAAATRKAENGKTTAAASEKKTTGGARKKEPGNKKPSGEKEKKPSKGELLLLAWKNGTVRLALAALGRAIRHASPGFFMIEGRAGLADPADTGMAAGLVYAFLPSCTRIEWVFTEKCMDLSAKAAGRIVPGYLLYLAADFALEPPVRETMNAYRKISE